VCVISYRREDGAANALGIGQYLENEFGCKEPTVSIRLTPSGENRNWPNEPAAVPAPNAVERQLGGRSLPSAEITRLNEQCLLMSTCAPGSNFRRCLSNAGPNAARPAPRPRRSAQ
jgi:hypothetical protein